VVGKDASNLIKPSHPWRVGGTLNTSNPTRKYRGRRGAKENTGPSIITKERRRHVGVSLLWSEVTQFGGKTQ